MKKLNKKSYCNPPDTNLFKPKINIDEQKIIDNLRKIIPPKGIYDKLAYRLIDRKYGWSKKLIDMRCFTFFDLTNLSESTLINTPSLGYKSVLKLRLGLSEYGLYLNK